MEEAEKLQNSGIALFSRNDAKFRSQQQWFGHVIQIYVTHVVLSVYNLGYSELYAGAFNLKFWFTNVVT